ncbi:UDP-N-acetylmuramoylalanine--D-glutamate ligase [uncultured delta proteobacterium]|uniref:UDP-N-acetylmuramoylalanine--D-glutamate ligase n=1 Tax=uncultured delta proteobacterium TaxID=34034 RepID=A0A212JHL6_9DELT|nr:UDP-N-acetylmuramoylalanine--D-glutamate ligase [uncultured delta proteobacterium]
MAVIGAGASGEAAARLLRAKGARVRLLERDPAKVSQGLLALAEQIGIEIVTGPHDSLHFQDVSLVVPSPGVPYSRLVMMLEAAGSPPVMAELELAWRFVDEPVLAVTGTSGKTTTVSIAAAMLREAGKTVFLGGNIGTPLSEYVVSGKKADVLVLEVSSFQLMGCDTFRPRVGMLLNISPNHLDQHESMREYVDAKFSMFARQTEDDVAIFGTDLEDEVPLHAIKARTVYFTATDRFPETRLLGAHNRANLEAAYLAAREFGVTEEDARRAVAAFDPLPNRLELVGEWNGVAYINDSKGTTVSALKMALQSMTRPVLLLAGGVFKGGDLAGLKDLLREKVKAVGLFGANREVFTAAWEGSVPITWSPTMEEAVRGLRAQASDGDVILLAPATASFDLYANYGERGADFRRIAKQVQ